MFHNRPYQDEQLENTKRDFEAGNNRLLLVAATGTGKCLGLGTPVLMFDGSVKAVEDIIVGDLLMGPDSLPRTVLTLARGREEMFRVTPVKGESYVVNRSHILSLRVTPRKKNQIYATVNIAVNDYLQQNSHFKHRAKGYRTEIDFASQNVPLDPYYVGLWIGDGNSRDTSISSMDA